MTRPFDHLAPAQTGEPVSLDAARAAFDADIPAEDAAEYLAARGITRTTPDAREWMVKRIREAEARDAEWLCPDPDDLPGAAVVIVILAGVAVWFAVIGWGVAATIEWWLS